MQLHPFFEKQLCIFINLSHYSMHKIVKARFIKKLIIYEIFYILCICRYKVYIYKMSRNLLIFRYIWLNIFYMLRGIICKRNHIIPFKTIVVILICSQKIDFFRKLIFLFFVSRWTIYQYNCYPRHLFFIFFEINGTPHMYICIYWVCLGTVPF